MAQGGSLDAFLHPVSHGLEKEVVISNRFKDKDGKPVPFRIKAITQAENSEYVKLSTKRTKAKPDGDFDAQAYQARVIVACTVFPDFEDPELRKAYGVSSVLDLPGAMLIPGEHRALADAIAGINDPDNLEEVFEEAKNA